MTLGATDTETHVRISMLDRIAVRSDMANWRMPSPWAIGFGIGSGILAFPVIKVTGSLTIAGILFVLSLVTVMWLTALMIRRAWCERHPYLPPRWLTVARATMGDDLIDAALERLRDTPPGSHDRAASGSAMPSNTWTLIPTTVPGWGGSTKAFSATWTVSLTP